MTDEERALVQYLCDYVAYTGQFGSAAWVPPEHRPKLSQLAELMTKAGFELHSGTVFGTNSSHALPEPKR
jgi:hypothetical protein